MLAFSSATESLWTSDTQGLENKVRRAMQRNKLLDSRENHAVQLRNLPPPCGESES